MVSLELQQIRFILVFRCLNGLAPKYLWIKGNAALRYTKTRGLMDVHLEAPKTDGLRKSFSFQGAKDWNNVRNMMDQRNWQYFTF